MIVERLKRPLPWPPERVTRSGGYDATVCPDEGVVTWNINTTCNYRCSYCTQRFLENRARWAADTEAFLEGFRRLPGKWEVKLSGGEPMQHPTLLEIVAGLRRIGHSISIVTNFSASRGKLEALLEAAGSALKVFSASLHLEYVATEEALDDFLARGRMVEERSGAFNATCVATRAALPRLAQLKERFERAGLRFKIQPEKQGREVITYSERERGELLRLGGHNGLGKLAWNFAGRPCWAGAMSFTLDDLGNAWRCYPARRYRAQYLGNFLSPDFQLASGPSPCLYNYCNCTVPIERGMMPRDEVKNEVHDLP